MSNPSSGYNSSVYNDGPYGGQPLPPTADYFILAEDFALRQSLKGITVYDGNNVSRQVGVWFGHPDAEIRSQSYPYLTIDLLLVQENRAQVHSSYGPLDDGSADYFPGLPAYDDDYGIGAYGLSPMLLTYQVTSWARTPRHDREIISRLNHGCLHPRFGQITVPNDNTVRRVVVTGFVKRDIIEDGKRLFRNIWTIQIPSEIFYDAVDLTARAKSVTINPSEGTPPDTLVQPVLYPGLS